MKNRLFLKNTLNQHKNEFFPLHPDTVKLYVCGITPYDYAHIGHGRCYVTFDLLYRLLNFLDYKVTYCRNFTDIDDKLLARAEKEYGDSSRYVEISQKFIDAYTQDMQKLNCLLPNIEPRVTEHIPEIIAFIEELIMLKKAYVVDGDVYFSLKSFEQYGKLSKRNIDDLLSGARVAVREDKHDALDFALWKSEKDSTKVSWPSPWGNGRPGWHIECSALSRTYLGSQIDIHGGGMDLIFPHHENEIAQTESLTGLEFSRYWVHNAFVRINKEKMSKSLHNFFSLRDVFETYNPMLIRYYILMHHYGSPLDFAFDDIDSAAKSYQRLAKFFAGYKLLNLEEFKEKAPHSMLAQELIDVLADDLNTSAFWGIIFENIKTITQENAELAKAAIVYLLGITLELLPEKTVYITQEIEALIAQREQARLEKDWKKADLLRDQLKQLGFDTQDKKS